MDEPTSPILRAFVGRTFNNPEDKALWLEIREVLDNLRGVHLSWEDAEEPQMLSVSSKIRKKIAENQIYVGILTRRKPIMEEVSTNLFTRIVARTRRQHRGPWSVSPWVVQESGYALGLGKKVLFLLEEGVDFPTSDMQADAEWVRFVRSDLKTLQMRLITILLNEIGKTLPLVQDRISTEREQVPAPPKEQAEQSVESSISFRDVRTQVNQKNFTHADELFEQFSSAFPEDLRRSLQYRFLRLKAASGHQQSLELLQKIVLTEPDELDARLQLAEYFQQFNKHTDAIKILRSGLTVIEAGLRPELYRRIARALATDNSYESAVETLVTVLQTDPLPANEVIPTFITLADIAEQRGDKLLESSALERAVELEPADTENRFRLAFLYSNIDKHVLAAYHYKIRLAQDDNTAVKNNLAVAFGNLHLRAREIELYLAASATEPLARANLSNSYVDGGFLREAERLARDASNNAIDNVVHRASSALSRSREIREAEAKQEVQILIDGKTEAQFRSRFADAFLSDTPRLSGSFFNTKYGALSLEQLNGRIVASRKEEVPQPFFASLLNSLPALMGGPPRIRWTVLEASVMGRSARYSVSVREATEDLLASTPPSNVEGLIILAADGASFEMLEDGQSPALVHFATRVNLPQPDLPSTPS